MRRTSDDLTATSAGGNPKRLASAQVLELQSEYRLALPSSKAAAEQPRQPPKQQERPKDNLAEEHQPEYCSFSGSALLKHHAAEPPQGRARDKPTDYVEKSPHLNLIAGGWRRAGIQRRSTTVQVPPTLSITNVPTSCCCSVRVPSW